MNAIVRGIVCFLLTFLLSFFTSGCSRSGETGLNPGDLAPQFELPDLNGAKYTLAAQRGKVVLVNFWASWCGPCVAELPALESLFSRLSEQGFVVLAIGVDDDEASLREFQRRYSLTFPVLFDASGDIKSKFKIAGVPESFIVGRDGRLVLFADPASGIPSVRIIGPRTWNSPNMVSRISSVITQNSP